MTAMTIGLNSLLRETKVTVSITGKRRLALRMWLAARASWLLGVVAGVDLDVVVSMTDPTAGAADGEGGV